MSTLRYKGCTHFRQRLICSTLTGRPLVISEIRAEDDDPGLRDFEGNFLRLLEKLTNGCKVEINETGTMLRYRPGVITGGRHTHDCGNTRAMGWFLEGVLPLCLFAKEAVSLTLTGITNDDIDVSVDTLRLVTLPLLKQFGVEGPLLSLKIKKRGLAPKGGGLVEFSCPIVKELRPLNLVDGGLVKRVRGVSYCAKISPQFANRVVESGRRLLNRLLPDVFIHTDHYSGFNGGLSPGYGLMLMAETTTGCQYAIDTLAPQGMVPEDLGTRGSRLLLEEVKSGGCVDSVHQSLVLLLMILSPEDVGRVRLGKLSLYTIQSLRHYRDFFGVTFKVRADTSTHTTLLSCLGVGFKNMAKAVT